VPRLTWAAAGIGIGLALLRFFLLPGDGSFDQEYHLFLADHYRRGWFEPWEERWYRGFLVYSYPPLVHQVVALLGHGLGLELSYVLVELIVIALLPIAVWFLALTMIGRDEAGWASVVASSTAGTYLFLFTFGQLPAICAIGLMLAAGGCLRRYLESGEGAHLAAWAGFTGATLGAHHQTGLVAFPALVVGVQVQHLVSVWRRPRGASGQSVSPAPPGCLMIDSEMNRAFRRVAIAAGVGALVGGMVAAPLLWWILTQSLPQTEIPHPSRTNFFQDRGLYFMFFGGIWGGLPMLLPASFWIGVRTPPMRVWIALATVSSVLGLGTMTPLPRMLFPGWWHWLTYERFSLWATVMFAVPAGLTLSVLKPRLVAVGVTCILSVFATMSALYLVHMGPYPTDVPRAMLISAAHLLDEEVRPDEYYLTLGLGVRELARLSRLTQARTIDGVYYTARRDPVLRASGIATLDEALWSKRGEEVLRSAIDDPSTDCVGWILSRSPIGDAWLAEVGWQVDRVLQAPGPALSAPDRGATISVWRPPAPVGLCRRVDEQPWSPTIFALFWGVLPISCLTISTGSLLSLLLRRRRLASRRAYTSR
jgi:hypothetical protein